MAGTEPVVLYGVKDHVARVTLNRPEARNALSPRLVRELDEVLGRAADDPDARVVIVTGAGESSFSAGETSLGAGGELGDDPSEGLLARHEGRGGFTRLFRTLHGLGKPVLARVNGECLSAGLGLALGCDLVVASNDATFGTPEVKHGVMPMLVMATLIRNCGRKKAMELILTGRRVSAREAERLGMINHAVPVEELDSRVDELADGLARCSPAALRLGRDAFHGMADLEFGNALTYLQTMLTLNLSTEDAVEGVAALLEKRDPVWKGR